MNEINRAKEQLRTFLNGRELTFSVRTFDNGEWIAECNEIDSIITGGMGNDISEMDRMIRDAILTAAGVNQEFASDILKFTGHRTVNFIRSMFAPNLSRQIEYALP